MKSREVRFSAVVNLDGLNPYVDVPESILKDWGGQGNKAPVLLRVALAKPSVSSGLEADEDILYRDADQLQATGRLTEDGWFRTTIVPRRRDAPRLYLDQWMRKSAGISVGDEVAVVLRYDLKPRELELPDIFRAALNADPEAKACWEALAPSRQREILSYLQFLKTPAALERNVQKTIASLKE